MLTPQSILLSIVLGILTLVAAVGTFMNYTEESLIGLILWIVVFAAVIYDTECISRGNCGTWSWIRTVIWSIVPIFVIVVLIMAMVKNKRRVEMSSQALAAQARGSLDAGMARLHMVYPSGAHQQQQQQTQKQQQQAGGTANGSGNGESNGSGSGSGQ